MSLQVPVVISAAHCSLRQQTGSSEGDSLKVVFRGEHLFSSLDTELPMMHLMNNLRKKGCFFTFSFIKLLIPSFYINIW